MLQWTIVSKSLFKLLFAVLFSIYLGVELVGCVIIHWSAFWRTTRLSFSEATPFRTPPAMCSSQSLRTPAVTVFPLWLLGTGVCSVELPRWCGGKEPARRCRRCKRLGFNPCFGKSPGEGNGNPLWYSCLENFMNRRAWWLEVTRSQTTELLSTHAYPLWRNVYSSPLPFFWLHPKAWRILFPQLGVELGPRPLALKVWSSDHWTAREFPLLSIFSEAVCPFVVEFCCCWVYVLDIKSLSSYVISKYFLSLCRLSLYFLDNVH